jgi:hypothetical protein
MRVGPVHAGVISFEGVRATNALQIPLERFAWFIGAIHFGFCFGLKETLWLMLGRRCIGSVEYYSANLRKQSGIALRIRSARDFWAKLCYTVTARSKI